MAGAARPLSRRRPRGRRLEPATRRLELIETAERVLRQRGAADTRVEDVVRAAGVAKGTFYLYFGSWDDLLLAVRGRIFEAVDARLAVATSPTDRAEWWTLAEALAVACVDFVLGLEGLHAAVFHGSFAGRHPLDPSEGAEARIAVFIEAGMAAGVFRALDPLPAARLIFALLHETADAIAEGRDRTRALATLTTLLRRCLGDDTSPAQPTVTHAARR